MKSNVPNVMKLLATMLICCMVLPLSAFAAPWTASEGSFIEHIIALPDGYTSMTPPTKNQDGQLAVAAKHTETGAWHMLTWTDISSAPNVTPLQIEGGQLTHIDYAPDGSLMGVLDQNQMMPGKPGDSPQLKQKGGQGEQAGTASAQQGEQNDGKVVMRSLSDDMKNTIIWFAADGTTSSQFEVKGMLMQVKALSDQRIAALGMQTGLTIYDVHGNILQNISEGNVLSIAASNDTLYAILTDKVISYQLSDMKKAQSISLNSEYSTQAAIAEDGTLLLINNTGAHAISPTSAQATEVMKTTGYLLGDPYNEIKGLTILKDGILVAAISEGTGMPGGGGKMSFRMGGETNFQLAAYVFSTSENATAKQDFVISGLRSSAKLRKAAGDFQRMHPELNVILQTQLAEDDQSPSDDAIRTLNTDLLAGKGGDVLILDGLPIEKYAQKGVLMDLQQALTGIDFLPGILSGSTDANGHLYAMPAQFSFHTLWGQKDIVAGIQSLDDLLHVQLEPGQMMLQARTPEEWLRLFYPASEMEFRDAQGNLHFDTPAFAAFLEALYQLYSTQADLPAEDIMVKAGGFSATEMQAILNGSVALYPTKVDGLMQLELAYSFCGAAQSGFMPTPALTQKSSVYVPSLIAGINAQSSQKELAVEFMKILYSPSANEMEQAQGLPTVISSLEKLFADSIKANQDGQKKRMIAIGGMNPVEIIQPDIQTWETLRQTCDTLNVPFIQDETLMQFIIEETSVFFEGTISSQDAAYAVEQRAWPYLNE